jgi:hypothetical protein
MLAVLATCSGLEPHAFRYDEFNRDLPTFNKPLPAGTPVVICYNGLATSQEQVQALAERECAQQGRTAVSDSRGFGRCPLFTPRQAEFACVLPAPAS